MKNIMYINAGAGSGKTFKLTEILSEKLTEKEESGNLRLKPSEVILTTFTELAASEFRERSRQRLYNDGHPKIVAQLDSATIGTVHSVALNFIQKYWYLIGVSPDMKVMSEEDLQIYISESLGDYVTQGDLDFFRAYCTYFGLQDGSSADLNFWKDYLLDIIVKISNYSVDIKQSISDSKKVVEQILFSKDSLDRGLYDRFVQLYIREFPNFSEPQKNKLQNLLNGLKNQQLSYANINKLYKELTNDRPDMGVTNQRKLKTLMGEADYDALVANLSDYQTSSKGNDSPGGMMKQLIEILFNIAQKWYDGFNNFKKRRHIIDYNDMERLFLALLEKPQVKAEIEGTYKLMMVDEFQDSSPIQLEIFKKLSDMMVQSYWVGDPKQSIYGFRGADVELVSEVTQQIMDTNRDPALGLNHGKLDYSWRSREPLVHLVNDCFTRAFEGLIDKENVVLTAARKESDQLSYPLSHWNCKNEGEFVDKVADRIKVLLDSQINIQLKNKEEFRPIQPRDIAVLCRKKRECKAFAKALISKGIPVTYVNDNILQQTEVQLVITLLKFMVDDNNKHVRADLLRLLDDVTTQDILQQRLDYLISLHNDEGKEEKDLWLEEGNQMIQKLKTFKEMFKNLSVSDLVESIIYGLDLPAVVSKWGDENNRRQNLQTLSTLAKKYDEHCLQMGIGASVGGLLTYYSYVEPEIAIDNSSDAVKVLTYHKAKGLEWNYVILSSLDDNSLDIQLFLRKNFWGVNELRHPAPHDGYNYIIQFLPKILATGNTYFPEPIVRKCQELATFKKLEDKERKELRHLLYVGMTRARDYLTTLSKQGKSEPVLSWVKNTGISDGLVSNLWNYKQLKPNIEDITDTPCAEHEAAAQYTHYQVAESPCISSEPKYLSPSKLPEIEVAKENVEILKDLNCRIEPYKPKDVEEAAAGTCIHNIFAVYDPGLSHDENVEKAVSIRNGNNMYEVIPNPDKVIISIEQLYAWLEQTYGKPFASKHETPFIQQLPGQIVHGEIDLLWYLNDHEVVLIDFKNYPGNKESIMTPSNKHYAGNYAAQLKAYKDVLEESGIKVKDTLIYYSVMGCVVRLKM